MLKKKLVLVIFSAFVLLLVSGKSSTPACAALGWTCCTEYTGDNCPGPYGCAHIPACDTTCSTTELKNHGSNNGVNECGVEKPISNRCDLGGGGAGDSAACRYASVTPNKLTLKVNQGFVLKSNAFANGVTIGGMTAVSGTPAVVSAVPGSVNLCCEWSYGYRQTPVDTTVTALREGVSKVTTTFKAADSANTCFSSSNITVSGVATPPACIPGTKCVNSKDNAAPITVGSSVVCSMGKVTDLTLGTPVYQQRCTPYKGVTPQAVIAKSSSTGTFPVFTVARGVTKLVCIFRYCQTASNGIITCSAWGTPQS